jgi:hypothetical protein
VLLPRFRRHRRAAADALARCCRVSRSFRRSVGGLVCRLVGRLVGRSVGRSRRTSPTTTGDVVEIHATHHQKNGWLRYITHVLVMINRKPFRVLVMIYEYHRRRDS